MNLKKDDRFCSESNALILYKWCYVNADNEFNFMNLNFTISQKLNSYKVYNKYGTKNNYENESAMDEVLVAIYNDKSFKFFNQKYEMIENDYINIQK